MTDWFTSSACNNSACVEVAFADDQVLVRDSKNPEAAVLVFTHEQWELFMRGTTNNEFTV